MKILHRYLFTNLLMPLLYLIMAFTLLFIIGDLMDTANNFLDAGTSFLGIAHYYTLLLPSMVIIIVPLCLLLAVLYSLSSLTRHSEITAMRASGISIYRIIRPYLLMGIVCLLFTTWVNEIWGPKNAYRAHQFLEQQELSSDAVYSEMVALENPTVGHSWRIDSFDTRNYAMTGITLTQKREDGSDKLKITALKGNWLDGRWWFEEVVIQHFDKNNNLDGVPELFPSLEMRKLPEVPEDFMGEIKDPAHQSSMELRKYIRTHSEILSYGKVTSLKVDFHHKLTMPFICIIATIIGIPVGAHTGRKGAFAGIMMAIGMFFGFYAMQFVMEYLAKQMWVDPWIGPWSAILVFLGIGSVMIHRMR